MARGRGMSATARQLRLPTGSTRRRARHSIIAVTGSNGKTTTMTKCRELPRRRDGVGMSQTGVYSIEPIESGDSQHSLATVFENREVNLAVLETVMAASSPRVLLIV
jgi:UDP-N-acetylmuramyl tripeptide synthase